MITKAARVFWGCLAALLGVAIWLSSSGALVLRGLPLEVLEGLARGKDLILSPPPPGIDGLALIGRLPGDAHGWASVLTIGCNVLAALGLFVALSRVWRNPISPTLAIATLFFGGQTLWCRVATPGDSLLHLLLAVALAAVVLDSPLVLAGTVLATLMLAPDYGLALFLVGVGAFYPHLPAKGRFPQVLALLGCAALLFSYLGLETTHVGLRGWSPRSCIPILFCALNSKIRHSRGRLYASWLLASVLTGTAELASAVALGDLACEALRWLAQPQQEPDSEHPTGSLTVRGPVGLGILGGAILLISVLPGERYLNRTVLIPAQKSRIPFQKLLGVVSLSQHAQRIAVESWRSRAPYPELNRQDYQAALDLAHSTQQNFAVLSLDSTVESRQVALLYALTSEKPLRGWDDSEHLAAPLLLCKFRQKNFLSRGPTLLFRQGDTVKIADPAPVIARNKLTPLDFRSVLLLPYRIQSVSRQVGTAYRWSGESEQYELSFGDQQAEIMLSNKPATYRATSLANGRIGRDFAMTAVEWALTDLSSGTVMPSRSLVAMTFRLTNRGTRPLSSDEIREWRLETTSGLTFSPFSQAVSENFILYPMESTSLTLQLATPEPEGVFDLRASAITPEGRELEIPLVGSPQIRTWRRLPPVGTWLEEP